MEEIMEAVPVESAASPVKVAGVVVKWDGLERRLLAINEAVTAAQSLAGQLEIDAESLGALDRKEAKRFEQALSAAINEAEKARKAFNADYDTPKKRVAIAYQEAMDAVGALHGRYKQRRLEAEDAEKAAKMAELEGVYTRFMNDNGFAELAEAIPFSAIVRKQWANLSANTKTCAWEVEQTASGLMADWRRLSEASLRYPEQVRAEFIRTHDIGAALDCDKRMAEEAEQVRRVEAERDAVAAYTASEPEIVKEAEEVVERAAGGTVWLYTVVAEMTEGQFFELVGWLKANGIHGSFRREVAGDGERA